MEKQLIKLSLIPIIISFNCNSLIARAQLTSSNEIRLKISNYRKIFRESDTITLTIENISTKPLYYVIGREELDNNSWLEYHPDIKNDVLKDLPPKYEVLMPNKFRIINFTSKIKNYHHLTEHGLSKPIRFFVKYFLVSGSYVKGEKKIVSKVSFIKW